MRVGRPQPGASPRVSDAAAPADRPAGSPCSLAACVSALVVNANTSAVTILLPTISEDTGAPVAQLQWAVTGYMLVGAAVIVTSGALGDVFGRRKVFLAGLIALRRLVRADRHGSERRRHHRGADDPGSRGLDDTGLRHEPAVGRLLRRRGRCARSRSGAPRRRPVRPPGRCIGGVLVDLTGWQGLFWIDAAIAAACIPLTLAHVSRSRATRTGRGRSTSPAPSLIAVDPGAARARIQRGQRLGLDVARRPSAAS